MGIDGTDSGVRFSEVLRDGTFAAHRSAERVEMVRQLLGGRLPRPTYIDFIVQLAFVYAELERQTARWVDDPVLGPFLSPELLRTTALDADLAFLLGHDWADGAVPLPATRTYVDRIAEIGATWPAGLIAHHYTRYLGDLSGGRMLARAAIRAYGLGADGGLRFYAFDGIPDDDAFKDAYRRLLDQAPWDAGERRRIVDEANRAFACNEAIFGELLEEAPAA